MHVLDFCKNLNTSLYKVSYLTLSTVTVMDFYRSFCMELGIEPKARKIDMFKQIQERIKALVNHLALKYKAFFATESR